MFACYTFLIFILLPCSLASNSINIPANYNLGSAVNISLQVTTPYYGQNWYYPELTFYVGSVQIGNPPQTINNVIFDTASSNTWFSTKVYNPSQSKTSVITNTTVYYNESLYARPSSIILNGTVIQDTLFLGGLEIQNQTFVLSAQQLIGQLQINGIVGLGILPSSINGSLSLLDNLVDQQLIPEQVFTLDVDLAKGNLLLGGTNSSKYIEPITWVPVFNNTNWGFQINDILFNSTSIGICSNCSAMFSTGNPFYFASTADINKVYYAAGSGGKFYVCSPYYGQTLNYTFVIGGSVFNLTKNQYGWSYQNDNITECTTAFMPASFPLPENVDWTFGSLFSIAYYTIFDFKSKQIGYAKLLHN